MNSNGSKVYLTQQWLLGVLMATIIAGGSLYISNHEATHRATESRIEVTERTAQEGRLLSAVHAATLSSVHASLSRIERAIERLESERFR